MSASKSWPTLAPLFSKPCPSAKGGAPPIPRLASTSSSSFTSCLALAHWTCRRRHSTTRKRRGWLLCLAKNWTASLAWVAPSLAAFLLAPLEALPQTQNICERFNALSEGGTVCNLWRKGITSLSADDFDGLSNLEYLHLGNNKLSSLPADVFDNVSNLQEIWLGENNLSSLPVNIFDGLSKLRMLKLHDNNLSNLSEDVFDELSELVYLDLGDNNLSRLPADIFDGLSNLHYLFVSHNNNLSNLPVDIFDGLSELGTLFLDNNNLSSLSVDIFDGLSNLYYLTLDNNKLSSLPADIFDGLPKLKQLSLYNNNLSSLPVEIFDDQIYVFELWLRGNGLTCLPPIPQRYYLFTLDVNLPQCLDLMLSPEALQVREAGSATYTVQLTTQPTTAVTVTVSDMGSDVTVAPASLSFSTSDWDTAQTVTVSAAEDDNSTDDKVTLTHTAAGADYNSVRRLVVTVTDNDRSLVLSPSAVTVDEASSATYTVKLATQPTEAVTVTVSGMASDVTVAPASLSFSTSNWDTAQPVTVSADEDYNTSDEEMTLTHTAAGGDYDSMKAELVVTVRDNDPNICQSFNALSKDGTSCNLGDKGITSLSSGDFDGLSKLRILQLSFNDLSSLPEDIFDGLSDLSRLTLDQNKLSSLPEDIFDGLSSLRHLFLKHNKLTSLPEDIFAGLSKLESLSLTGNYVYPTGNGLICLPPIPQSVTRIDVTLPQCGNLVLSPSVLSPSALPVDEAGTAAYTVKLATQPTTVVTVTVNGMGSGVTVVPASLSFSTSNWDTIQMVTVSAAEDANASNETVTLTHTVAGGGYGSVTAALVVTVRDDDPNICQRFNALGLDGTLCDLFSRGITSLSSEDFGGLSKLKYIRLDNNKLSNLPEDVFAGLSNIRALALRHNQLSSLPEDIFVRLSKLEYLHLGNNNLTCLPPIPRRVKVDVNLPQCDYASLVLSSSEVAVDEADTATYTVKLATQPADGVTITVSGMGSGVTVDTDSTMNGKQTTLNFSTSNWDTAQPVTVSADEDANASNEKVTLTHNAAGGGYGSVTAELVVTVTDNDSSLALSTSIAGGSAIAEGGTARFTLTATPAPQSPLTVEVKVEDSGAFASSDQLGMKTVTIDTTGTATLDVTTDDDGTDEPDGALMATVQAGTGHAPSSTAASASVAVADDDDPPPPVVSIAGGSGVTEGDTASFTLTATPAPQSPLTVEMTVADSGTFAASGQLGTKTVTIDTTGTATLDVTTDNDGTDEPDGALTATVQTGTGYAPSGTHASAAIAVHDNDVATACVSDQLLAKVEGYYEHNQSRPPGYGENWFRVLVAFGVQTADAWTATSRTMTPMTAADAREREANWFGWGPMADALECLEGLSSTDPEITVTGGSGITEGGDAVFTVSTSPAPTANLPVSLTVTDDGTSDFLAQAEEGTRTVTISAGQTSATLTMSTEDDSTDEGDGSVTATVGSATSYQIGSPSTATVMVSDDDDPPVVTPVVSVSGGSAITEGETASFTLTATPAPQAALTVEVTVADSGAFAASGESGAQQVTLGTTGTATFDVATENDSTDEPDGALTATIQVGTGYAPSGTHASAAITVHDNDVATACVSDQLLATVEGYYEHNQNRPPGYGENWFRVLVAFGVQTADAWTATSRTIMPMTAADAREREAKWSGWGPMAEALECLEGVSSTDPEITVTGGSGITEGGDAVFTVSASPAPAANLPVSLTVTDDGTSDFLAQSEERTRTVTISAGQTSATLTVATEEDSTDEGDGSVTATVGSATGYQIGSPSSATVAVSDDNDPPVTTPVVSVSGGSAISEGGTASFTLTATPAPQSALTVEVTVADSGAFSASGESGGQQVTLGTTGTATFDVVTENDSTDEPDGTLTATVQSGTGYKVAASPAAEASVVVTDDDDPPPPVVSITGGSAISEGGTASFTLTATPAPESALTVEVTVEDSGAFAASGESGGQQVTLGTTGTATFDVVTENDSTDEPDGALTATVQSGTDYKVAVSPADVASVAVADNDDPPPPVVSITGGSAITEGGTASFTLTATPAPESALTVEVTVEDSGEFAASGESGVQQVTLGTTGTAIFDVVTEDDSTDEPDGALTATVQTGTGYTVAASPAAVASVAVTDDDDPPPPVVSIAGGSAISEGGTASFTLTATPAPQTTLTVEVTVEDSGAFAASGESGVQQVTLGTTGTATFDVVTDDDSTDEPDGTLTATVQTGTGYTVSASPAAAASVVVTDDDDPPPPVVSITGGSAISEGGTASFTLTATPAPQAALTVEVTVEDSGAFAASGESGVQQVTLGTTGTVTFDVVTEDDNTDEPNGALTATVQTGTGYAPSGTHASATIAVHDNEVATACVSDQLLSTVEGYYEHNQNRPPGYGENWFRVLVAFGVQTADAWTATSRTMTPMTAAAAREREANWSGWGPMAEALECLEGMTSSTDPEITVTGGSGISEGEDAVFTVSASVAPTANLPVSLTVTDAGTSDFLAQSEEGTRTVTILAGQTSATLTVSTEEDSTDEGDGSVTATVGSATGYQIGSPSTATVAVSDDDDPPVVTPVVSVSGGSAITEGGTASFTLTATPAPQTALTVEVTVADSGAFAASGESGAQQVTLGTTGTATFDVVTDDDNTDEPDGALTATVQTGTGYTVAASPADVASLAVADNDAATVVAPSFSISDATANENSDWRIFFTIRLNRPVEHTVAVTFSTRESNPVSAREGQDYQGLWRHGIQIPFFAGQTEKQIWVPIFNDHHDEDPETFEALLSNATNGAVIGDGVGIGTITNSDLMPAAWLSRFGRTVSQQVVAALQGRFAANPQTGLNLTLAGEALTSTPPLAENQQVLAKVLGFETVTAHQLVEGSSFSFSPEGEAGSAARFAIWGQGALSSFSGQQNSVALDGDVTTALVGAEWSGARWRAGAALSHSWGSGSYTEDNTDTTEDNTGNNAVANGDITTTLTGIFPYGRYGLTPRLAIWAVAGYGWGSLSLKPDGAGTDYSPGTSLTMGAVGMDGLLRDGGPEGLSLSSTADALLVKTTSEAVAGLASSEANISRLRLGLEATRPVPLANGAALLPSLELGIRHDDGDAETGFGMELAAGLTWTDPGRGISAELQGRTLLTHSDEDFREQGLTVSFAWEPNPTNRGPSLALSHAMGATAAAGMDALLNPTTMEALTAATDSSGQHQFEASLAYGFPAFNDRLTITPGLGLTLSPDSRTYSLLWALAPYAQQPQADELWQISLEGERQENSNPTPSADHSLALRFSLLF